MDTGGLAAASVMYQSLPASSRNAVAAFRLVEGRYLFGADTAGGPLPAKAKLLIDDGPWYFDLRGTWMRGGIGRCEPPSGGDPALDWYELAPEKTVAWHYGELRDS